MALVCDALTATRGSFTLTADWAIPAGSKVAVIGPSGAGKSLLLSAIAGFENPTGGRLRIDGVDVTETPPGARPVSIMFQDHNLFPHISAFQNVALGLAPNRRLTPNEAKIVEAALTDVDLAGLGERRPAQLSGGQQSRVALARTMVRARPLLLLDEPFAALGPGLRRDMLALVRKMTARQKSTLLYVTHQPEEAETADLAIFVEGGRSHAPVPPGTLFANPPAALSDYL